MATFTLTGTFKHQDGTTPIVGSPIEVKADPFSFSGVVQTDKVKKSTDANGAVSFTLTTGLSGLNYVVRSLTKTPLFTPKRFAAPASGATLDINTLVIYNPPTATVLDQVDSSVSGLVAGINTGTRTALDKAYSPHQTTNLAFAKGDYSRAPGVSGTYNVIGVDTVNDILYARDDGNGVLRCSTAVDSQFRPTSWSNTKGLPTGVSWFNVYKILTFGTSLYMLAVEDATGLPKIYRATPATGNTVLAWSSALKAGTTGSTARQTCFTTDGTNLYFAEYGDPSGGPSLYRSSDGTTWTTAKTWSGVRHVHCVEPDPYNPGTIWAALGDGVANPVQFSTNSGTTWTNSVTPSQLTDIGFTATDVIGVDDTSYVTAVAMTRDGTGWRGISGGFHGSLAVPARSATKTWDPPSVTNGSMTSTTVSMPGLIPGVPLVCSLGLSSIPAGIQLTATSDYDVATVTLVNHTGATQDLASSTLLVGTAGVSFAPALFYGAVDPATGIIYMTTQQSSDNPYGALFVLLSKGAPPQLIESASIGNWPPIIWHNRLFYGPLNRPLIATT